MHPEDASHRSLAHGSKVKVSNDTGQLILQLAVSEELPKGVALIPKGRWPRNEFEGVNVNVLNQGQKTDMGESTAVHGIEVLVSLAQI